MDNQVAILGGGVGGVLTALRIAEDQNIHVVLFEKGKEILKATSSATPCRPSLGAHYPHFKTGEFSLEIVCHFVLHYADQNGFLYGLDHAVKGGLNPYRHCDYVVAKGSVYPVEYVEKMMDNLKRKYREIAKEKPAIQKFFGKPDDFYKKLDVSEYPSPLNRETTQAVFRLPEHVLNWPLYRKFLLKQLEKHPRISVQRGSGVTHVSEVCDKNTFFGKKYRIFLAKDKAYKELFDMVVNATWYNVWGSTSKQSLIPKQDQKVTQQCYRLKAMIVAEAPEAFDKTMPHQFRCFGANVGMAITRRDNLLYITSERHTNVEQSLGKITPSMQALLNGSDTKKASMIAEKIIESVSNVYKGIAKAKIIDIKFGVVINNEKVDIFAKGSAHEARLFTGVEIISPHYVINQSMKQVYCVENAEKVFLVCQFLYRFRQFCVNRFKSPDQLQGMGCNLERMMMDVLMCRRFVADVSDVEQKESDVRRVMKMGYLSEETALFSNALKHLENRLVKQVEEVYMQRALSASLLVAQGGLDEPYAHHSNLRTRSLGRMERGHDLHDEAFPDELHLRGSGGGKNFLLASGQSKIGNPVAPVALEEKQDLKVDENELEDMIKTVDTALRKFKSQFVKSISPTLTAIAESGKEKADVALKKMFNNLSDLKGLFSALEEKTTGKKEMTLPTLEILDFEEKDQEVVRLDDSARVYHPTKGGVKAKSSASLEEFLYRNPLKKRKDATSESCHSARSGQVRFFESPPPLGLEQQQCGQRTPRQQHWARWREHPQLSASPCSADQLLDDGCLSTKMVKV